MSRIYSIYPPNWEIISRDIRYNRAKGRCEQCGIKEGGRHSPQHGIVRLAVAHLGYPKPDGTLGDRRDKSDCRPENLKALCQRCHLALDREEHQARAIATRWRKMREKQARMGFIQLEMSYA